MIALALVVGACAGDSPGDTGRLCAGNLYDICHSEHDCLPANGDCHNFASAGFQVCSKGCTVGDDSTCGSTSDGQQATCVAPGVCTPPAANPCTPPR